MPNSGNNMVTAGRTDKFNDLLFLELIGHLAIVFQVKYLSFIYSNMMSIFEFYKFPKSRRSTPSARATEGINHFKHLTQTYVFYFVYCSQLMRLSIITLSLLLSLHAFSQDGTIDQTFGTNGVSSTEFFPELTDVKQMVVQPDGRILQMVTIEESPLSFVVFRHLANGNLDNSFGTGGKFTSNFSASTLINDMILQPDGKILLCGHISSGGAVHPLVVRLHANGIIDSSFGSAGKSIISYYSTGVSHAIGIALQQDGKIVGLTCPSSAQTVQLGLFRINADGSLDNSFDGDGKLISNLLEVIPNDRTGGIKVQPDGKIVIVASKYVGATQQIGVARFNTDGSFDNSFGTNGIYISNHPAGIVGTCLAIQPDGKILAGGSTYANLGVTGDFALIRFTTTGQPDSSFGTNGFAITDVVSGSGDIGFVIAVQNDGKILMSGDVAIIAVGRNLCILRFTSNGLLDNTFGTNGKLSITETGMYSNFGTIGSQGNKIILSGCSYASSSSSEHLVVFRLNNSSGFFNPLCNLTAPVITISGNVLTSTTADAYQWYLNGNLISGATGQSYTASSSGIYSVVISSGVCTSTFSNSINYSVTAVDPSPGEERFTIAPNPAFNRINIQLPQTGRYKIQIFNMSGQLVYTENQAHSTHTVHLSSFAQGKYMVRIINTDKKEEWKGSFMKL